MAGDVVIAVTQFAFPTAGSTDVTVTTTKLGGKTPKAALFFVSRATSNGTNADGGLISFGATDGSSQWAMAGWQDDARANTNLVRSYQTAYCCTCLEDVGGDNQAHLAFKNWETNGVTLTSSSTFQVTDQPLVTVVFFAGDDLQAAAGSMDLSTSSHSVTGLAFEPSMLFFGAMSASSTGISSANVLNGFGVVSNQTSIESGGFCYTSQHGSSSSNIDGQILGGTSISLIGTGGELVAASQVSSFNSDGFTLSTSVTNSGTQAHYLALFLDDRDSWVGAVDSPTSTGDWSVTGPGFTPQVGGILQSCHEAYDTSGTDFGTGIAFSVFDDTDAYTVGFADEDGSADSDAISWTDAKHAKNYSDDAVLRHETNDSGDVFTASGWTISFSTAYATAAKKWIAWAIEEPAASAATVTLSSPTATATGSTTATVGCTVTYT